MTNLEKVLKFVRLDVPVRTLKEANLHFLEDLNSCGASFCVKRSNIRFLAYEKDYTDYDLDALETLHADTADVFIILDKQRMAYLFNEGMAFRYGVDDREMATALLHEYGHYLDFMSRAKGCPDNWQDMLNNDLYDLEEKAWEHARSLATYLNVEFNEDVARVSLESYNEYKKVVA